MTNWKLSFEVVLQLILAESYVNAKMKHECRATVEENQIIY